VSWPCTSTGKVMFPTALSKMRSPSISVQLERGPVLASAWLLTMISPAHEDGVVPVWRTGFWGSATLAM
jgi:hypothetical protein